MFGFDPVTDAEDFDVCPAARDEGDTHCGCWWDGDGCCRCRAPREGLLARIRNQGGVLWALAPGLMFRWRRWIDPPA